ncbi:MMPL family transporter [Cohnella endophytica]|uniref:MMPL family transporter n=1 Tax=Cohnella endophytica TaxID=2419778 RepID=A0A494Y7C0_9BACL|nr:MMPL family transporter [Cohnella endophytica]RKP58204.1 MMPL family transporter [Cohnella endophytica]
MIYRKMTSFAIRYSSLVLGFWIVLTVFFASLAVQLPNALGDHGLVTEGQYAQVQEIMSREFHLPEEPVIVLFENQTGKSKRAFHSFISRTLEHIQRIRGVNVASSPLERQGMEKGKVAYALLSVLPGSAHDKSRAIDRIREEISGDHSFSVTLTGKPVIQEDVNRSSKHDLKEAERIGVPVAFILLVFTLGGLLPAVIPIIAGAMTVIIAMGIMYGIGVYGGMTLSVFVYNVIPMVGMAVCIDFALLMVSRFREERVHLSVNEALLRTMATSGRAVVVSVGCVILALISTFYIRMPIFNSVTLGTLVVLAVSLLINLTLVPALLYTLRRRIYSNRPPRNIRRRSPWLSFISTVMKRPLASAAMAIVVLSVCLFPIHTMQVSVPGPESLPKNTESRMTAEALLERLQPPYVSQVSIIVKDKNGEGGAGLQSRRTVTLISREIGQDPRVIKLDTIKSSVKGGLYFITVWLHGNETSKEVMQWVRDRTNQFAESNVLIGGEPKYHQEIHDEIFSRMKYVLLFVILSNLIVLSVAFRSILIPLKAITMNLVSIGASFGILTWIFQEGRFGLEPTDIAIMIPVFIFGLTFGISMDYGIFLLSRIQECYRDTEDNDHAIREGLTVSGKIITSAAAIMIAVTAPFALADIAGVKQLGIGIATALFLDATIVRMLLVPSLMKLFGKWNWWMPFAKNKG